MIDQRFRLVVAGDEDDMSRRDPEDLAGGFLNTA
jgi:hypothetical protein